jgi:hypothetical protein
MDKPFKLDIRPLRGTFYFLVATGLVLFGLLYLFNSKTLGDALPVFLWCLVCGSLLGWRALANLTGSEDMRSIGKPAAAGLLMLIAGGRLLLAVERMRLEVVQRHGWLLWVGTAVVLGASGIVFARVRAPTQRSGKPAPSRGWQP